MLTIHLLNLFSKIKKGLNLFIFLIFMSISDIYSETDPLLGKFHNSLLLQNKNLFITNSNGMYIYDTELQNLIKTTPYYGKEISDLNIETIAEQSLIAQFENENGMIICLVLDTLYFFDNEGEYLFKDNLPSYDYSKCHSNLLTYKTDDNYNYYIITFIKDNSKLCILYYKVNNTNNELIHEEIFKPFYFDFPSISIIEIALGCGIMDSSTKGKILTCCFQTYNGGFIIIQSFIIEKDFQVIGEDVYSKVESPDSKCIHSLVSENGKNLLTFYRDNNEAGYYFIYDIDDNKIIKNEPLIKRCINDYKQFKLFYFKNSSEYIFACSQSAYDITVMKMDSDFNIINANNYSDSNYRTESNFYTFSIFYDTNNKYVFIMDQNINIGNYVYAPKTAKFIIDVSFDSVSYSGGTPPSPYSETLPSTTHYELPITNKYYLNIKEYYRPVTVNDKNGIVIDFLSNKNELILTRENTSIKKNLYAINIENLPLGQLKYIINGELVDVELNKRIFGEFKFFYIPDEEYSVRTKIVYRVYLRNYSIASISNNYWLIICKKNCSCSTDTGSCSSCAKGYGFYERAENCVNGSDYCSNRYYTNNDNNFLECMNGEENECPVNYPIYNEYSRECSQNTTDDNDESYDIDISSLSDKATTSITTKSDYVEEFSEKSEKEKSSEVISDNPEESESYSSSESSENKQEEIQSHISSGTSSNNPEESESSDSEKNEESSSSKDSEELESNNSNESSEQSEEISEISKDNSDQSKTELISDIIDLNLTKNISNFLNDEVVKELLDLILGKKNLTNTQNSELLKQPEKAFQILSSFIKAGNINMSSGNEDIILKVEKIIYQITNTLNQKNSDQKSDISIIDLGECEKIIKRNISYEDDPTPLIIIKTDTQKEGLKSSVVNYEVYNPYTKEKIDLSICANVKINILSPVNLTIEETELYDELKNQGYDLYDANDSFYQDICTQFTTKEGTDVIISDRKNYYYDINATFCEESCTYQGINTENKKVSCSCEVQNDIKDDNPNFDREKFFENFYKIEDYTNYKVLYCYKLVFSKKGIINNICFYIFIVLVLLFLVSMVINLLKYLKKIDEIIFKIFQEIFMHKIMQNILSSKKSNFVDKKELNENDNNSVDGGNELKLSVGTKKNKKLGFFRKLRQKYKKKSTIPFENNININIINNIHNKDNNVNNNNNNDIIINNAIDKNENNINNKEKKISSSIISKNLEESNNLNNSISTKNMIYVNKIYSNFKKMNKQKEEKYKDNNGDNNFNHSIKINMPKENLRNSCITPFNKYKSNNNNSNPPLKKNETYINKDINNAEQNNQNISQGSSSSNKKVFFKKLGNFKKKRKAKNLRKSLDILVIKSNKLKNINNPSYNLKNEDTSSKNQLWQKNFSELNKNIIKDQGVNKIIEKKRKKKVKKNTNYIDEELNKMNYENALIYDQRTYCQFYVSLLKKKHLIILVFISNEDYNVFILKFSLFILSLSLFFALNTLFFRDSVMRHIFTNEGRYNFLYQIPQILYSTLISGVMTYILKILSLSQNDLIKIKKEPRKKKAKKMADNSKRCLTIKLYIFNFIGLALIIFCWYYTTAFAAVYPNTQLHLIKDTLISFGISMIYPFIINIIPGLLRIPSLKDEKKNRKCLYKISQYIAFL